MSRFIDVEPLREDILYENDFENHIVNHYLNMIDAVPTADVEPMIHGRWIPVYEGASTCECSACRKVGFKDSDFGFIESNYCPECGAKMGWKEE